MIPPEDILNLYFSSNPAFMTQHHLESYNDFIMHKIPAIVKNLNPFLVIKSTATGKPVRIEVFVGGLLASPNDAPRLYLDKPEWTAPLESAPRPLYPNEARLYDRSYVSHLYADIDVRFVVQDQVTLKTFPNVLLGTIPIMLHSCLCTLQNLPKETLRELGECIYDQGGYFIVDGKEKVIVAQEHNATNIVFVTKSKDPKIGYQGFINCTSPDSVFPKTTNLYALSEKAARGRRRNAIVVTVPHINTLIPLFVLFRALGVESDREILEYIVYDVDSAPSNVLTFLEASVVDGNFVFSQEHALEYLKQFTDYKSVEHVRYLLLKNLFPNIEPKPALRAFFLGFIVHKLVRTSLGLRPETDRDNYMFKRVKLSGMMLSDIFKDFYNAFRNASRSAIDREFETGPWKANESSIPGMIHENNLTRLFPSSHIQQGMLRSMKGKWGLNSDEGIVQDLARISYAGFISHLRRVNTPLDRSTKIVSPHRLNTSQYGYMCPVESPDGASIGLLKHFAMLCHVSYDVPVDVIHQLLNDAALQALGISVQWLRDLHPRDVLGQTKVLINNNWVAVTQHPERLVQHIRLLRRARCINAYVSVAWNISDQEVVISCDAGRCVRPLLLTDPKNPQRLLLDGYATAASFASWSNLGGGTHTKTYVPLKKAIGEAVSGTLAQAHKALHAKGDVMEFVDVQESNTCMIAMDREALTRAASPADGIFDGRPMYTHCEIHPATMLSMYTATIPLSNHNQAPRNIFSGAQGKQALGIYASSFHNRIDTMSYVLHYPQKALVGTRFKHTFFNNALPNGENAIVAIMTYTGYNQEDAVIINEASIQRGMFNVSYFKSYVEEESLEADAPEKLVFGNPVQQGAEGVRAGANYRTLDANGFPIENTFIQQGDAILGKVLLKTETSTATADGSLFTTQQSKVKRVDKTTIADKTMSGFIDKVVVYEKDQTTRCKIRFRKVRIPTLGDKVASSHGQKGVIGMILPEADMPFARDGLRPDLIVNAHAFPSRMTIGHLIECLLAKAATLQGVTVDGTPFEPHDYEPMWQVLEKRGYERMGNDVLYCGLTGQQMPTEIFMGPTFYFRLKHMVEDKINYRSTGPITAITHQPTKGRGNEGGLRIGEMEQNVIGSHGLMAFLKESFTNRSDGKVIERKAGGHWVERPHRIFVDEATGLLSFVHPEKEKVGSEHAHFAAEVPYAFKLFIQEMRAMSIDMRFHRPSEWDQEDLGQSDALEETAQELEADDAEPEADDAELEAETDEADGINRV